MHADPVIFLFRFLWNLLEPKQAEGEEEEDYDVEGYAIMRAT